MESQFVGSYENKHGLKVGIDRIAGAAELDPIGKLVEKYRDIWHNLAKTNLKPNDKVELIKELLVTLGGLHAACINWRIDTNLDLMIEAQKFYHWASQNINENDRQFLSQAVKVKSNPQSDTNNNLMNSILQGQSPLAPSCLINVMDALYANQQSQKLDSECALRRHPIQTPKNLQKKQPELANKFNALTKLIAQVDEITYENRKHVRANMAKEWLSETKKTGSQPTSPELQHHSQATTNEVDTNSVVPISPETLRNSKPTSPNVSRHEQPISPVVQRRNNLRSAYLSYYGKETNSLFHTSDKMLPVFNYKEYNDDLLEANQVKEFTLYDKIVKLAFSILNDPEFQALKDKDTTTQLLQLIVDCSKLSINLIDKTSHIQTCFIREQQCSQLAYEISKKITFGDLSYQYLENSSGDFEEQYIATCLGLKLSETFPNESSGEIKQKAKCYENENYELKPLGGGNDRVYLIKDKHTQATVILRGRFVFDNEMRKSMAPDQMRFRVCGTLGVDGCASQIYAFIPGAQGLPGASGNFRYRNYEISEALPHGDLDSKFRNLHNDFNAKLEEVKLEDSDIINLQINILETALKLVKLIVALKEAGICWADLKPSNVLFDENGEFIISDIKTWIDMLFLDKAIYQSEEPLQLTPGYLTIKTSYSDHGMVHYDLNRVINETVAFTLYQLITGNTRLETIFTESVTLANRDKMIREHFSRQLEQLNQMTKKFSKQANKEGVTKEAHPIYSGPLGKYLKELTMFVYGLVNNDQASLETILGYIDTKQMHEAIKNAKQMLKVNSNITSNQKV